MTAIDDILAIIGAEPTPEQKVLREPFDPKVHKATFTNYLEVVVLEDGTVEYAVPSHLEKLKQVYREEFQADPDEDCPTGRHGDYLAWLSEATRAVPVWSDRWLRPYTAKQRQALLMLTEEGLLCRSTRTDGSSGWATE